MIHQALPKATDTVMAVTTAEGKPPASCPGRFEGASFVSPPPCRGGLFSGVTRLTPIPVGDPNKRTGSLSCTGVDSSLASCQHSSG